MAGQFGLATESVFNTGVTVTKFIEPDTVSQTYDPGWIPVDGIRAGRRLARPPKLGSIKAGGSMTTKFQNTSIATLLGHVFGAVNTTGAGPYAHAFSLGSARSFTAQVGIEDENGTVRAYTHTGCKVTQAIVRMQVGQASTLQVDWAAANILTATALATASYPTTLNPFIGVEGALSLDGTAVGSARSATMTINKGLKVDRHTLGSRTIREQREEQKYQITWEIDADFEDNDYVANIIALDELDVIFAMDNGPDDLTITSKAYLSGDFPGLTTNGLESQSLKLQTFAASTDLSAFAPVLTNTESSAA